MIVRQRLESNVCAGEDAAFRAGARRPFRLDQRTDRLSCRIHLCHGLTLSRRDHEPATALATTSEAFCFNALIPTSANVRQRSTWRLPVFRRSPSVAGAAAHEPIQTADRLDEGAIELTVDEDEGDQGRH